jgi:hypothetical protein
MFAEDINQFPTVKLIEKNSVLDVLSAVRLDIFLNGTLLESVDLAKHYGRFPRQGYLGLVPWSGGAQYTSISATSFFGDVTEMSVFKY